MNILLYDYNIWSILVMWVYIYIWSCGYSDRGFIARQHQYVVSLSKTLSRSLIALVQSTQLR